MFCTECWGKDKISYFTYLKHLLYHVQQQKYTSKGTIEECFTCCFHTSLYLYTCDDFGIRLFWNQCDHNFGDLRFSNKCQYCISRNLLLQNKFSKNKLLYCSHHTLCTNLTYYQFIYVVQPTPNLIHINLITLYFNSISLTLTFSNQTLTEL